MGVLKSTLKASIMRKLLSTDGYKLSHFEQYPKTALSLYGNLTARSDKHFKQRTNLSDDKYVVFGIWQAMKEIKELFDDEFFSKPFDSVVEKMKRTISNYTNFKQEYVSSLKNLHELGYLPLIVKSVPEGMSIPVGMPCMTIKSDDILLFSYLEPMITALSWKTITNATTAREYYKVGKHWAERTGDTSFVSFQFHDFGSRGMSGIEDMGRSGSAHLVPFKGTESVAALTYVEDMYNWDYGAYGPLAATIEATEHSVASSNIMYEQAINDCDLEEAELHYLRRYITEVYPSGMVAYVADTFDFFRTVTSILPKLKKEIMNRDGKLVIRPDSFDPVEGLCGIDLPFITEGELQNLTPLGEGRISKLGYFRTLTELICVRSGGSILLVERVPLTPKQVGTIPLMWGIFGGTTNSKGYKELDSHVGVIYGDGISANVANTIFERLEELGFASTNLVIGVGAGSYQWCSRDTLGIAYKATLLDTSDVGPIEIYKDPVGGNKKSAKGLLSMKYFAGEWLFKDCVTEKEEAESDLVIVFVNGYLSACNFNDIRERFLSEN